MVRKAMVKGSVFLVLLMSIIAILNSIFILKTVHRDKLIEGLYNQPSDAYDVVLMGSSHMNGGLDPNVLWHQYGITSFNYATGGQPIDVTYYLLKEVLEKHKNPIVVMDLYYLGSTDEYGEEGYVRYVLDNMNFSMNKLVAIINCTPLKDRIDYLFPIFEYHDRWKELTAKDFNYGSNANYAKGFEAGIEKYGKDDSSNISTTKTIDLPPKTMEYLVKIIDLSKKDGFKLIFTNTPYDYNSPGESSSWVKEPIEMFNKVAEIAKENNIPFINYCDKMSDIGFDFKEDMNNAGHVNIWGAVKVTMDMGKFLKENYSLVDHRTDNKYAQWNSDYVRSQAASLSVENKSS
ncbi:SGNH/GDSL hydrolase family protein [Desulfosporosinus sp. Sb-LF]|uniref:SGNH/GDSL hydrolase family protein n=1 Tax=Desulfosporosinus sp. Sb-LF TaxID=2560027 RepID=UPI00107F0719|nr:SGNH/GDSL hydrolase family protein [Desulfosporosinus sp. Sb-LF]TGE31432.1 SGNH/GDSL hydrolase family protein [Desulfosporosinus sp. Sb-LF]